MYDVNRVNNGYSRPWVLWRTGVSSLIARLPSCLTRVNLILGIKTASPMLSRTVSLSFVYDSGLMVSNDTES